jgi:hypothetical protein
VKAAVIGRDVESTVKGFQCPTNWAIVASFMHASGNEFLIALIAVHCGSAVDMKKGNE